MALPNEFPGLGIDKERTKAIFDIACKLREEKEPIQDIIARIAKMNQFNEVEKLMIVSFWDSMQYYDETIGKWIWMIREKQRSENKA